MSHHKRPQIISVNIDKKVSNMVQIAKIAHNIRPAVICLQDVFSFNTRPQKEAISTLFQGYIAQTGGPLGARLTTLTCQQTTRTLDIKEHTEEDLISILMMSVTINNSHSEDIVNIYIRPKASPSLLNSALNWINNNTNNMSRILLMGDMNATGALWDSQFGDKSLRGITTPYERIKANRGHTLEQWIALRNLTCLNEDYKPTTFNINSQQNSSIDLVIVGSKSSRKWKSIRAIQLYEQGHSAIIINASTTNNNLTQEYTKLTYDLTKINERMIDTIRLTLSDLSKDWSNLCREDINSRMNLLTDSLCSQILSIQQTISKPISINKKITQRRAATLEALTHQRTPRLIQRIRRAEKRRHTTKSHNKRRQATLRKKRLHEKLINRIIRNQYKHLKQADIWNKIRHTTETTLDIDSSPTMIDTKNKLETIAKEKFPTHKRSIITPSCKTKSIISKDESERAIQSLKGKKYNTPEGINMKVFYMIARQLPEIMHQLAQMSFITCSIPKKAEFTSGTIIPKKAKGQFRIVHVPSAFAAFLEAIALARLNHRIERNGLINKNQFGFTALRSRQDLLARLLEQALRRKKQQQSTYLISMDIEGAFDNVNQEMLVAKLANKLNDAPLTAWIGAFLRNRKISIKYHNLRTQYRPVCKGVPQGSALGPVLWNYAIHDLEEMMKIYTTELSGNSTMLKYADDIYLVSGGDNERQVQTEINNFVTTINMMDLNVRPEKCSYMILFEGTHLLETHNGLRIYGKKLDKVNTLNILGMHMTKNCQINKEDDTLRKKLLCAAQALNKLNRAKLVNHNREWKALIEGLILSRTIYNYWPLVLHSSADRNWIMSTTLRAIKAALSWPPNTSNKLVKLIMDLREPITVARKLANNRIHLEAGNAYRYLMGLDQQETEQLNYRRHPAPETSIRSTEYQEGAKYMNNMLWYLLEGAHYAGLIRIYNGSIQIQSLYKSYHDPSPYTNSLVTLTKSATNPGFRRAHILINQKCSVWQALKNYNNHDHRIISLRESIHKSEWTIIELNKEEHEAVKRTIKRHIKQSHDNTLNDEQVPSITSLFTPDTSDYLTRLTARKQFEATEQIERASNMTSTCKEISTEIRKWLGLNPASLKSNNMMMLTGLIRDQTTKELTKDQVNQMCELCNKTTHQKRLWHRANECSKELYTNPNKLIRRINELTKIALSE